MNAGRSRTLNGSSPVQTRRETSESKWSWSSLRHDLAVGLISGTVVAVLSLAGTVYFDDRRSERETRLANLSFVRERSSTEITSRPYSGMDLKDMNLAGLNLSGADLTTADLRESDLLAADLSEGKLEAADFSGADLRVVIMANSSLDRASFKDADLFGATINASTLKNADLRDANLTRTLFVESNLKGANLAGADLTQADLTGICYDEATIWPKGFAPPASADNCVEYIDRPQG
jgi:uncharacterized protein YjbI with pentapeptide repeats